MKALLFSLALTLATAAQAQAPDEAAGAVELVPGKLDATWSALFEQLGAKGALAASFTENRFLPFKKIPVVFRGEIRFSPEQGLSLHYTSPEDRTMIVDTRGVVLRDSQGRSRELPSDPRANAATSALLHVMRFDLPALEQHFRLSGLQEGKAWRLLFDPRDGDLARQLSRLVVEGDGAQVRKITMRKSALQRIEILIDEVKEHATFTPEEKTRFFR